MRQSRLRIAIPAAVALAGAIASVAGLLLVLRLAGIAPDLPPLQTAIAVEATITDRHIEPGETGIGRTAQLPERRHVVHYAFFDAARTMQSADAAVSAIYYRDHPPGSIVTAWHYPGRPEVSVLERPDGLAATGARYDQLAGGILAVLGLWLAVGFSNRALRLHRGYGWL